MGCSLAGQIFVIQSEPGAVNEQYAGIAKQAVDAETARIKNTLPKIPQAKTGKKCCHGLVG